jgi:hypothetical protein
MQGAYNLGLFHGPLDRHSPSNPRVTFAGESIAGGDHSSAYVVDDYGHHRRS